MAALKVLASRIILASDAADAPSPEPHPPLKRKPPAAEQAQALLEFLHRDHAGSKVRAVDVKAISYPQEQAAEIREALGIRKRVAVSSSWRERLRRFSFWSRPQGKAVWVPELAATGRPRAG